MLCWNDKFTLAKFQKYLVIININLKLVMFYTSQAYNVESTGDSFGQGAQYSLQHTALSLHDILICHALPSL